MESREDSTEQLSSEGWLLYNYTKRQTDESPFTAQKKIEVSTKAKLQDKDEHQGALRMMDDESEPLLSEHDRSKPNKSEEKLVEDQSMCVSPKEQEEQQFQAAKDSYTNNVAKVKLALTKEIDGSHVMSMGRAA